MAATQVRTAVNEETVKKALLGDDASGTPSQEVSDLASFFSTVIDDGNASMLMLCARLGARDTDKQVLLRDQIAQRSDVTENLKKLDQLVAGKCSGGYFGGSSPDMSDAIMTAAVYNLFALLYKPQQRAEYASLLAWFEKCISHLGSILGGPHMLGTTRAGGQIDCFAEFGYVRKNADFANSLNSDVKKKKTQRQLEKEAKAAARVTPEASQTFLFTEKISVEAGIDEKIVFVQSAIAQVGGSGENEVVKHNAAHTMADMPNEIREKGGFVCKNLFLKAKKPRKGVENDSCIWLISVPEDVEVDLKTLSKELGYKDELRQTKPDLLLELLGVQPGCVTPFGLLNDAEGKVNVILDENMMSAGENRLWFHPLTNEATLAISADDLFRVISATARKPILMKFEAAKASTQAAPATAASPATDAGAEPLNLTHEEGQKRLWDRLAQSGVVPRKEENPDLTAKRPVGHSTHNLFVKDKKTKKLFLVAVRQGAEVNLKDVAKKVGAKELRMSSDSKEAFCLERGCMSLMSLYNNVQGSVVPVIDSSLLNADSLLICAGCEDALDHSQHNVVDVKPSLILELLAESNSPATVTLDLE